MIITKNAVKITPYFLYQRHGPCPYGGLTLSSAFPQMTWVGPGLTRTLKTAMRANPLPVCYAPRWTGNIRFGLQVWSCRVWWTWSPGTCWAFNSWVLPARVSGFGLQLVLTSLATAVAAVTRHHKPMGGSCTCGLHFGWHRASSSFLSPPCAVSHSLFKELPKFMRKYLVLSLPQILTQRLAFHDIIVSGVRATIHRSTLFVETWKKVFWK